MPTMLAAVAALVLGAVVGSHIGLLADRLPRSEPALAGRSRCRTCGTVLSAFELVPIASYLWQRGRCRRCDTTIPADTLLAELGGAAVTLLALAAAPSPAGALALALFGWGMLLLGLLDLRHFWLPDRITLPLVALGIAAAPLLPAHGWADRAGGAAAGYLALSLLRVAYRRSRGIEGLGGGDAKLLAAIGAWLGFAALPWVVLGAALAGLCAVLAARLRGRRLGAQDAIPFGTPLALAACIALPVFA